MKSDVTETSEHPAEQATAAWIAVVRAYNECTATLAQRLAPLGISLLEHEVLMNLLRAPGLTQQQLSERCFSAKSGISMLVARLEKEGVIARARSKTDRRAWSLFLGEPGMERARAALKVQARVVREMAGVCSVAELEVIETRMDAASEVLRQMRTEFSEDA
jgi:DNA-binding MarR family transcriptional regulator